MKLKKMLIHRSCKFIQNEIEIENNQMQMEKIIQPSFVSIVIGFTNKQDQFVILSGK
jgi:hypothetical protein